MAGLLEEAGRRFEALSLREQVLIYVMGGTFVLLSLVVGFILMHTKISSIENEVSDNDRILLELTTKGERLLEIRQKRDKEEARFERELPPLPGLLERLAGEAGIEIPESRELPDDPTGKKWVRKSVEVRLRRVGLKAFTDFMVKIENENKRIPLAITSIKVKKRAAEPDSYDVDITVSAYTKTSSGKKKKKRGDKKKEKADTDGPAVYGPEA
ncbi:MAG: hypothetical protein JRG91_02230 [Deltaproteobacteria bacterium]|nr:hypothetical protein [Deltaproteobacteria bacterium]